MIVAHWPDTVIGYSPDSLDIRIPLPPHPSQPYQPPRPQLPSAGERARPLVTLAG